MGYSDRCEIGVLLGKTLESVVVNEGKDEARFKCADGTEYLMLHNQDCCEGVDIEDICGDLADLIGSPVTLAEESTSTERQEWQPAADDCYEDSFTWTFYRIGTAKGMVTIRWYGQSNGYYSEGVDFEEVK
jgi:hypothetical protein